MTAKEGILLDREGKEIPTHPARKSVSLSLGPVLGPLVGAGLLALVLFAGMTLFGTFLAVLAAIWTIRGVLSLFGLVRPAPRQNVFYTSIRRDR